MMRMCRGVSPEMRPPEPTGCPECGAMGTFGEVREYQERGAKMVDLGCIECGYVTEEGRIMTSEKELRG